jgi:hypothetical protein
MRSIVRDLRRAPALPALALLTCLVTPAALRAQHAEIGVFSAWGTSLGGGRPLYGASMGRGAGIGLRVSGALRTTRAQADPATIGGAVGSSGAGYEASGWTVDMDFTYDARDNALLQPIASALLGFSPSVFVGAGAMGRSDDAGALRAVPVFSYGGGVSRSLIGGLGLTSEARWRAPVRRVDGSLPEGLAPGWEYRAGLALRFGGRRSSSGRGMPRFPIPLPGGGGSGGTMGSARGSAVVDTGEDYLGVPYVYGGSTPRGFDCSGFVQYVFNKHGVRLPRTSRQQAQVGRALPARVSGLQVGDLLLFSTGGARVDHVGIYAGDNRMLHSSSSGGGVGYDELDSSRGRWFVSKLVTARRVTDGRGNSVVDQATLARLLRETVTAFDGPDRAPRR